MYSISILSLMQSLLWKKKIRREADLKSEARRVLV